MEGKVYFFTNGKNIKIGYTTQSLQKRLKQLTTGSDGSLQILGYIKGNKEVEHFLHQYFSKYRIRSNGEWFIASEEIISFINTYNEMNVLVFVNEYYDNKLMAEIRLGIDYNIKKFNIDEFKRDMELL